MHTVRASTAGVHKVPILYTDGPRGIAELTLVIGLKNEGNVLYRQLEQSAGRRFAEKYAFQ